MKEIYNAHGVTVMLYSQGLSKGIGVEIIAPDGGDEMIRVPSYGRGCGHAVEPFCVVDSEGGFYEKEDES